MRKSIFLFLSLLLLPLWGLLATSDEPKSLGFVPVTFTSLPSEYLYPSYLADPLAVNSQISYREYSIEEIHPNSDSTEGHFDITLGTRYNFWRFSPEGRPDLGIEMDWGMAVATFMNTHGTDMLGFDGIYYFSLAIRPTSFAAFRLTRHHFCSHNGDQLDTAGDGSEYVDFDLNPLLNDGTFVRDDYVFSAAVEPLAFLDPVSPALADSLMLYGDYSIFLPGYDLLGRRSNTPSTEAYIWYQYGFEFKLPVVGGDSGHIFLAGQLSRF